MGLYLIAKLTYLLYFVISHGDSLYFALFNQIKKLPKFLEIFEGYAITTGLFSVCTFVSLSVRFFVRPFVRPSVRLCHWFSVFQQHNGKRKNGLWWNFQYRSLHDTSNKGQLMELWAGLSAYWIFFLNFELPWLSCSTLAWTVSCSSKLAWWRFALSRCFMYVSWLPMPNHVYPHKLINVMENI